MVDSQSVKSAEKDPMRVDGGLCGGLRNERPYRERYTKNRANIEGIDVRRSRAGSYVRLSPTSIEVPGFTVQVHQGADLQLLARHPMQTDTSATIVATPVPGGFHRVRNGQSDQLSRWSRR